MITAYPEVVGTTQWPITISELVPWSNMVEGQIVGECHGAAIRFFDTRFYRNRSRYRVGETYTFSMGALAYTLEPARHTEAESEELGAKISFKGACAYMPASVDGGIEGTSADIDDYWFHSPLGGMVEATTLAGRDLKVYPITIAIPEQFEMNLDLLTASHSMAPDLVHRQPGDDLEGFLWLQGQLADR